MLITAPPPAVSSSGTADRTSAWAVETLNRNACSKSSVEVSINGPGIAADIVHDDIDASIRGQRDRGQIGRFSGITQIRDNHCGRAAPSLYRLRGLL